MSAFAERLERERAEAPARDEQARAALLHALGGIGLPTVRDDAWKYANLRALERARFVPAPLDAADGSLTLPPRIAGFSRQVFLDGHHSPALSDPITRKAGQFMTLRETPVDPAMRPSLAPAHALEARFALLNAAFAVDGARIAIGAGDVASRLELIFAASADAASGASYPRVEVELASGAHLELIERHVSAGEAASSVTAAVELRLAARAHLKHFRLQQMNGRTLWVDTLLAHLEREAAYDLHMVSLGAISARSTALVTLGGEAARIGLGIASVAERAQVLDGYARIEHAAPRTVTRETFRGIAGGRSRVAFNGMVHVRPGAAGTDSVQSLRGLITGAEAEIDARPQLEIYTDDVRCSHGATAGRLDESMLFYLLSRGIDRATAQSLLEWAFLEDVIARIDVRELRKEIEGHVAGRLRGVTHLAELL